MPGLIIPAGAQIKLTDRKSSAFRESKKNKNKKQKKRVQTFRNASRQNLKSGETDLVPEALKEHYVPKKQNVETNPSRVYMTSQRKQKRIMSRKTVEGLRQGMKISLSARSQQYKARKQSRMIANHQGDIPFVPLALRDRGAALPQPEAEKNPAKSNRKIRNQKLAMYSQKSEEMQYQGLIQRRAQPAKNSGQLQRAGLRQGLNTRQKEAEYMAKSVEAQGQGIIKGRSQERGVQTQKAGLISGLTVRQKEAAAMAKSVEGLNQGLRKSAARGKMESNYVQKSREAQYQGMLKGVGQRKKDIDLQMSSAAHSQYSGELKRSRISESGRPVGILDQGLISRKTLKQQDVELQLSSMAHSQYRGELKRAGKSDAARSAGILDQGMMKGRSQKQKDSELQLSSMAHSQYSGELKRAGKAEAAKPAGILGQGMMKGRSQKQKDTELQLSSMAHSQYRGELKMSRKAETGRPVGILDQGMIGGKTQRQKDLELQLNSLTQSQYSGNLKRVYKSDRESIYVRKSRESQDQGLLAGKSQKQRTDESRDQSQIQSQFQGNLKAHQKPQEESRYIQKSQQAQKSGMITGLTAHQKEVSYMAKSLEGQNQGLTKGVSTRTTESQYIRKSREAFDQGRIKGKTSREQNADFGKKSLTQTQFQGNLKGYQKSEKESKYIQKSQESQRSGLISGLTIQQKDAVTMAKSVEGLSQGLTKSKSIKEIESNYIRKSMEINNAGMIKGYNAKSAENEARKNSSTAVNYQGDYKVMSGTFAFIQDWKEKRIQSGYLKLPSGYRIRAQLFDNIHNLRISSRQAKFDGMNEESNVERWWASLWRKPQEPRKAPAPLRKPRYDPKEHEIWNY
ncbi:MAG TPA: hypothetical protein VI583_01005 [Cyclobacteriaceae bacterium]|nr:hypothetical protein [Cyclobacteriaceae bacterium]